MSEKTTIKISKATRQRFKESIPKSETFEDSLNQWLDVIEKRNRR